MPQLYVLRRFSSWSFRLGVSTALLLSSVGLAGGLLVGTPLGEASLPRPAWRSVAASSHLASDLNSGQRAAIPLRPASLNSLAPAYVFAAEAAAPPAGPAGPAGELSTPAGTLRATVQHSWHTFKQAFR